MHLISALHMRPPISALRRRPADVWRRALLATTGVVAALILIVLGGAPRANPQAAVDSDGDGASDADELLAGTNPRDASSVFRLLGPPERSSSGTWRITWASEAGKTYQLQRTTQDDFSRS